MVLTLFLLFVKIVTEEFVYIMAQGQESRERREPRKDESVKVNFLDINLGSSVLSLLYYHSSHSRRC